MDIRHDSSAHRFETNVGGQTAWLDYERDPDGSITITHTIVPRQIEGQGIGSFLVRAAHDFAMQQKVPLHSVCSFATIWLQRNASKKRTD
ncbi:GNAT family N-acetyltransferase [Kozakia baliensis]|uniref:GNAT family N-acetyltransferase n=1 Tax=Kozakia baliensis TaxID=153496 RepID=UPI00345BB11F